MRYVSRIFFLTLGLIGCCPSLAWASPVVIVDAGSSGTRLHVFTQDGQAIHETTKLKITPGLSTLIEGQPGQWSINEADLQAYLARLVQPVHAAGLDNTPMYVYATAGMRLYPQFIQQQLMHAVQRDLSEMGFTQVHAAVITGQQEAVYDWLSVNMDALQVPGPHVMRGVVDLGGASLEIAFDAPLQAMRDAHDRYDVTVHGRSYHLLAKSYLGLGKDYALAAMDAVMPASRNACYPSGVWPTHTTMFDWQTCHDAVAPVFMGITITSASHLLHETHALPATFVGIGALYYSAQFLQNDNPQTWQATTQSICEHTWSELKARYPQTPEKYLKQYCVATVYGDAVLDFLQVHDQHLTFARYDWARGAALAVFSGMRMPG